MELIKEECLISLEYLYNGAANGGNNYKELNEDSNKMLFQLINKYFGMIDHMKETSLYDVYEYENKFAEPMRILVLENEDLKNEVNDLRKQLGLCKKYKTRK